MNRCVEPATAYVVTGVLVAVLISGCSRGDQAPASPAGSHQAGGQESRTTTPPGGSSSAADSTRPPSPTPSGTATYPPVPDSLPGQIAYASFTAGGPVQSVTVRAADPAHPYVLRGVCLPESASSGPVAVRYELETVEGKSVSGGDIPCRGTSRIDSALLQGSTSKVRITLLGPFDGVSKIFAAVVPDDSIS